ncbi:RQC-minor-1 family DNA-binding protein [Jeotgalibacillus proteolyticus]|uniref:RQC-minor-1 family DNA-binding protein n=1 Tax=Jeotgalibacillus proteolyticus TaxID=2082395 RepID=UPI003CED5ADD
MNTAANQVTAEEIKVILRAADEIIFQGGRTLLAKILKGSKEKKVMELKLDQCPVYGFYKTWKLDDILLKIDWMIDHEFFEIRYDRKLPMIVFSRKGWQIQMDQYTDELLEEWREWIRNGHHNPDMSYLKDRNREMILLLIEKIKESREKTLIPYLELWEKIDYKKVKQEIRIAIEAINQNEPIDPSVIKAREEAINEALEVEEPVDLMIKCWGCLKRFTFSVGEQQFFKQKGLSFPNRCKKCRKNPIWR